MLLPLKKYGEFGRDDKKLSFLTATGGLLFYENKKKRFLELREHDSLLWSTVRLSIERAAPTTHPGTHLAAMWGFSPENLDQYPGHEGIL